MPTPPPELRHEYVQAAILLASRFSRYNKLTQLKAPQEIINNEMRLVQNALTQYDALAKQIDDLSQEK